MICIPYWALGLLAFCAVVGTAVWRADVLLEWLLSRVATEVTPAQWNQLLNMEATVPHMEDPERVERRLRGALHEISPETRQAWARENDRQHRRVVRNRVLGVAMSVLLWAALYWFLHR